jgi:hypothetical protein
MNDFEKEYEKWMESRPECVQELAKRFPIHSRFVIEDTVYFLIGYNEDDSLIVSKINPNEDYDKAIETKEYICAKHLTDNHTIKLI